MYSMWFWLVRTFDCGALGKYLGGMAWLFCLHVIGRINMRIESQVIRVHVSTGTVLCWLDSCIKFKRPWSYFLFPIENDICITLSDLRALVVVIANNFEDKLKKKIEVIRHQLLWKYISVWCQCEESERIYFTKSTWVNNINRRFIADFSNSHVVTQNK